MILLVPGLTLTRGMLSGNKCEQDGAKENDEHEYVDGEHEGAVVTRKAMYVRMTMACRVMTNVGM